MQHRFGETPFSSGRRGETGGWLGLREERPVDALAIAVLADAWFPAPWPRLEGARARADDRPHDPLPRPPAPPRHAPARALPEPARPRRLLRRGRRALGSGRDVRRAIAPARAAAGRRGLLAAGLDGPSAQDCTAPSARRAPRPGALRLLVPPRSGPSRRCSPAVAPTSAGSRRAPPRARARAGLGLLDLALELSSSPAVRSARSAVASPCLRASRPRRRADPRAWRRRRLVVLPRCAVRYSAQPPG